MNDPKDQPIDIEEMRAWVIEHKEERELSWNQLANSIGMKSGTLSQFGSPKGYAGREDLLAEKVFRYRQTLASQAALRVEAPTIPGYYETETSRELTHMLHWAQRGRIVTAALGAGLGKTSTARHFKACNSNVFLCTCAPSSSSIFSIQRKVLGSLGSVNLTGSMMELSARIEKIARGLGNPLLILDEAQHLTERALEEVRSWHDETGLGIALFGNEKVMHRLTGGNRSAELAQLFSRNSLPLVRSIPLKGDIDSMLDAWDIADQKVCAYVHQIASKPGGLRGATFALELAVMLADASQTELAVVHVQEAWAQLSTRARAL